MKLTAYERIVKACGRNTGMHLTAEEVWTLAHDTAVIDRAAADTEFRKTEEAEAKRWQAASRVVRPKVRKGEKRHE